MTTIRAVFENGVFRSKGLVPLPEHTEVEFEPRLTGGAVNTSSAGMEEIYRIMEERFDGAILKWQRGTMSISHEDGFSGRGGASGDLG